MTNVVQVHVPITFILKLHVLKVVKYIYTPRERSYIGITLSVCLSVRLSVRLSVQIRVRSITFFWFDIGLPYLAHGCITIRQCVAYIHDPDSMLTFDFNVKFKGFSCTTCNFC